MTIVPCPLNTCAEKRRRQMGRVLGQRFWKTRRARTGRFLEGEAGDGGERAGREAEMADVLELLDSLRQRRGVPAVLTSWPKCPWIC
jgi:hypothetical protein